MKLTGLNIDGFGVWNDLSLHDLNEGVTAIYGPNEAGKTTLMHFVRTMLYGFSPERRKRFLPPVHGGRPGGWLELALPRGSIRLTRYVAGGESREGEFSVDGGQGPLPAAATLRAALGDIDEPTFTNIYAVGLREIQELGTLSDSDAASALYSLTTGLDRISLLDVVRNLEASRQQLLSSNGGPSRIKELFARRVQLQDEIDQLVANARRWSQLTVRLQELALDVDRLDEERLQLAHRSRTIEIAAQVRPKWLERADLDRRIEEHSGGIRLPDDAITRLEALHAEIEEHERQREVVRGQRHVLRDEVESLGINEMLVRNASRIEALGEQRDWLEALERQQATLTDELSELQTRLAGEHERLGFDLQSVEIDPAKVPEISEGLVATLRPHARAVRNCRERLVALERESEAKKIAEAEFRLQIESAMPETVQNDLPTDLDEAGELVANLRKRLQAEQRLEQSRRQENELQQQNHELLDRQESPLWMTAVLCLMLLGGMAVLAFGFFTSSTPAMVFGGVLVAGFAGMHLFKYLDEDQVAQRRDACHRQMELVQKQIDAAQAERAAVEKSLGPLQGSVVVRLQAAERHLAELEKILPVETRRREAKQESESAERRHAEAQRKLDSALANWQGKLKALGLPGELTPSDIRAIATRFEQVTDLRLRADRRQADVDQRRREHATLCKRIQNLAEEINCTLPDATPLSQLEHLQSELRQHGVRIEERDRLRAKAKELKDAEGRHARAATALRNRLDSTFLHAGVEDDASFRQLFREQEQADKLRDQQKALSREISAAIGAHVPEDQIAKLMTPDEIGMLDRRWEEAAQALEDVQKQLKSVVAKRGAIGQQLRQLAEDCSLANKQCDLAEVEEQLKRAIKDWRSRAAFCIVLDEIRARYERERQPETLVEASATMRRLTNGGYTRIWTPLGKEILFVDNADGDSLPVEMLSRGAREQVFLSLRLALIALLARRGVHLPMVLDDVLVNFDEVRARRAVEVLGEFASAGHQLLVFTCHEHVWKIFRELQFDTRRLPDRWKKKAPPVSIPAPTLAVGASLDTIFAEMEPPIEYRFDGEFEAPRRPPAIASPTPPKRPEAAPPAAILRKHSGVETETAVDNDWVRIGPQVRRRERIEHRTQREEIALSAEPLSDASRRCERQKRVEETRQSEKRLVEQPADGSSSANDDKSSTDPTDHLFAPGGPTEEIAWVDGEPRDQEIISDAFVGDPDNSEPDHDAGNVSDQATHGEFVNEDDPAESASECEEEYEYEYEYEDADATDDASECGYEDGECEEDEFEEDELEDGAYEDDAYEEDDESAAA